MADGPAPPLAPEAIVTLLAGERRLTRWHCTPEYLEELALGWLVGEGWIDPGSGHPRVTVGPGEGEVRLPPAAVPRETPADAPQGPPRAPEIADTWREAHALRSAFAVMFERGVLRERSGGVHTGALVVDGSIARVREDVSRHCVVDKLIGGAARDGLDLESATLLLSGRISGAIAAKGARAGLPVLATMSIPTTLAAEIARRAGVALIGRARASEPHFYPPST